jgi:hypothetical protein
LTDTDSRAERKKPMSEKKKQKVYTEEFKRQAVAQRNQLWENRTLIAFLRLTEKSEQSEFRDRPLTRP